MGRVINIESAGKERNQLMKAIVIALAELTGPQQPIENRHDLVAFIYLSLQAISETIDPTATAWEKRGYWVKADRFRMEWFWTRQVAQRLKEALISDDWSSIEPLLAQIAEKLKGVKVSPRHRMGKPWVGAWEKLKRDILL